MKDQISINIGIGNSNFKYGFDFKPNPYPNSGNYYLTPCTIGLLLNGSMELSYTKNLIRKNHFGLSISGSIDFITQGPGAVYVAAYTTTNLYNWPKPPVQQNILLYNYAVKSLNSNGLHLSQTLSLKIDFAYWINLHNKFNFGAGYNYFLNDLASGNYII